MSLKYDIIQGKLLRDLLFSFIYDLILYLNSWWLDKIIYADHFDFKFPPRCAFEEQNTT